MEIRKLDLPDITVNETSTFYVFGDLHGEGMHMIYVWKQDVPEFIRNEEHKLNYFLCAVHDFIYYSDELDEDKIFKTEYNNYFDEIGVQFEEIEERKYEFRADYRTNLQNNIG